MKLDPDAECVEYIFDFILWVIDALQDPDAKVLLHCALAALVN